MKFLATYRNAPGSIFLPFLIAFIILTGCRGGDDDGTDDLLRGNVTPAPFAPNIVTAQDIPGVSQVSPNDPDKDQSHSFVIISSPAHGTAIVSVDGVITYTPDANFTGEDSLVVMVTDSGTPALAAAVTIMIRVFVPAFPSDLQNKVFVFADGEAFDAGLAGTPVMLTFGHFDGNIGPFMFTALDGDGAGSLLRAGGTVRLGSCIFTITSSMFVGQEGPQEDAVIRIYPCEIIPEDGRFVIENAISGVRSTSERIISAGPYVTIPLTATLIEVTTDTLTLRQAINQAASGDIILLEAGIYDSSVVIDKNLVLMGVAAGGTTLQGGGQTVVTVGAAVSLQHLTITNGFDGVQVAGNASLHMKDVYVNGNFHHGVTFQGSQGAKAFIVDSAFSDNADGVNVDGTHGSILRNFFGSNRDDGIDFDGDTDMRIENNEIRNSGDDGIEIRLRQTTRASIVDNIITNSGEDGVEVIDSFLVMCQQQPASCSNQLLIANNVVMSSGRFGLGFVELPSEETTTTLLALDMLTCSQNIVRESGTADISPNYMDICS